MSLSRCVNFHWTDSQCRITSGHWKLNLMDDVEFWKLGTAIDELTDLDILATSNEYRNIPFAIWSFHTFHGCERNATSRLGIRSFHANNFSAQVQYKLCDLIAITDLFLLVQNDVRHVRNQFIAVLVLKSVGVRELCYPKSFEDEDCDELVSHRPRSPQDGIMGKISSCKHTSRAMVDAKWPLTNQPTDCC